MMKIAILGAGSVGATLGKAWSKQGHEVIFGVRDINAPKVQTLLAETENKVIAETLAEAAQQAEVVALTVPWESGIVLGTACLWAGDGTKHRLAIAKAVSRIFRQNTSRKFLILFRSITHFTLKLALERRQQFLGCVLLNVSNYLRNKG